MVYELFCHIFNLDVGLYFEFALRIKELSILVMNPYIKYHCDSIRLLMPHANQSRMAWMIDSWWVWQIGHSNPKSEQDQTNSHGLGFYCHAYFQILSWKFMIPRIWWRWKQSYSLTKGTISTNIIMHPMGAVQSHQGTIVTHSASLVSPVRTLQLHSRISMTPLGNLWAPSPHTFLFINADQGLVS